MRTIDADGMYRLLGEVAHALDLPPEMVDNAFAETQPPTDTPTGSGLSKEEVQAAYSRGCLAETSGRPLDYPHYLGLQAVADAAADHARKERT